jgi:hypothetical protein
VLGDIVRGEWRWVRNKYLMIKLKAHICQDALQRDGHSGIIGGDLEE